jgi:DNA-binding transcriptional MerR regulator
MFTIGNFAALGCVSVRMLRHYDTIGLLRPARTDPDTGYRWYAPAQLERLNRIIVLKDLGFTLSQVQAMVDGAVRADELRGMLRLRRVELEERLAADAARLARVEADDIGACRPAGRDRDRATASSGASH